MNVPNSLKRFVQAIERPDPASHHDLWGYYRWPDLTREIVWALAGPFCHDITHVIGVETRGLGLGAIAAQQLGLPFVPVRKAGSYLPGDLLRASAPPDWEGKRVTFELQRHALPANAQVLIVDDWLTTGSQLVALHDLVTSTGAVVVGITALVEEFVSGTQPPSETFNALLHWSDDDDGFVRSDHALDLTIPEPLTSGHAPEEGWGFTLDQLATAIDRRNTTEYHDLWGIYRDPELCRRVVRAFAREFESDSISHVVGVETRGLLLGPLVAQELSLPFVPIRKAGRYLPGQLLRGSTTPDWEGKVSYIEMQQAAIPNGARVLTMDDWCTTGSHICAARDLLSRVGADLVAAGVFAEEFGDVSPTKFPRLVSFLNWDENRGTLLPSKYMPR